MRPTAPSWLIHLLAIAIVASMATLSGCKDDAPVGASDESAAEDDDDDEGASAGTSSDDEAEADEASDHDKSDDESDDDEASDHDKSDDESDDDEAEAATDEAGDDRAASADDKGAGDDEAGDEAVAGSRGAAARAAAAKKKKKTDANADDDGGGGTEAGAEDAKSARARAAAAAAQPATDGEDADKATAEGNPPKEEAEASEDDDLAGLDPVARRKAERERRIAELKRRNEDKRKERLARLAERSGAASAAAEVTGVDPRELMEAAAAGADQPPEGAPPAGPRVTAKPRKETPTLDISRYLTLAAVRKATGDNTLMEDGVLSGLPASETYNSRYFAPPQRMNFGAAFQLWRERTRRDANERFRRMRKEYPNAEDTATPAPKSFFSYWGDVMFLVFADLTKRVVVTVSCSADICTPEELLDLAKGINDKL